MYAYKENCWLAHLLLFSQSRFFEVIKLVKAIPAMAPITCAAINGKTDAGAMPANESESVLATVTTGLAKLVDEVKK